MVSDHIGHHVCLTRIRGGSMLYCDECEEVLQCNDDYAKQHKALHERQVSLVRSAELRQLSAVSQHERI